MKKDKLNVKIQAEKSRADIYNRINFNEEYRRSIRFRIIGFAVVFVIIAICAIFELPHITEKYNKRLYVSRLQLGVSSIENGFKNAMAQEEVPDITDTSIWRACNISHIDEKFKQCNSAMLKYFYNVKSFKRNHRTGSLSNTYKNKEMCKNLIGNTNMWWHLNSNTECSGWNNYTFYLANGIKVDALMLDYNESYIAGQLTIDVNGDAPPNRWGRDTFMFNILHNGTLIPYAGTSDCKLLALYTHNNNKYILNARHWRFANTCSHTTKSDGTACAARIIENSWSMDY